MGDSSERASLSEALEDSGISPKSHRLSGAGQVACKHLVTNVDQLLNAIDSLKDEYIQGYCFGKMTISPLVQ